MSEFILFDLPFAKNDEISELQTEITSFSKNAKIEFGNAEEDVFCNTGRMKFAFMFTAAI